MLNQSTMSTHRLKNQKMNKMIDFGPAADVTSEGKQLKLSEHRIYELLPLLLQGTGISKMASSIVISEN